MDYLKKTILAILFLCYNQFVFSQSDLIVYYRYIYSDYKNRLQYKYANKEDSAQYYIIPAQNDSINGIVSVYYINGKKSLESNFKNGIKEGKETHWHKNGQLEKEYNYTNGYVNGEVVTWDEDGNKRSIGKYENGKKIGYHNYYPQDTSYYFIDEFDDDKFINGKKVDKQNNILNTYTEFYKPAEFNGGISAMNKFLAQNLKYPKSALKEGIWGKVLIRFDIDKNGNVSDAYVLKGIHPSIDAEALRIVNLMPKWQPAIERGEVVKMKMVIPFNFKLPD